MSGKYTVRPPMGIRWEGINNKPSTIDKSCFKQVKALHDMRHLVHVIKANGTGLHFSLALGSASETLKTWWSYPYWLVVSSFNPSKKYARRIGYLPQVPKDLAKE